MASSMCLWISACSSLCLISIFPFDCLPYELQALGSFQRPNPWRYYSASFEDHLLGGREENWILQCKTEWKGISNEHQRSKRMYLTSNLGQQFNSLQQLRGNWEKKRKGKEKDSTFFWRWVRQEVGWGGTGSTSFMCISVLGTMAALMRVKNMSL